MCLVSFIPKPDGFILSSNRDELPERAALTLMKENIGEDGITYPADIKSGSWIIMSKFHKVVCLLNGAFENHVRQVPYRMSRGVMMKEFFKFDSAVDFLENFNFINIEPFTMVIVEKRCFYEFKWDGGLKHIRILDRHKVHIWSSCTLYDDVTQRERALIITGLIETADLSNHTSLQQVHTTKQSDLEHSLFIKRDDGVQTISHTQIIMSPDSLIMKHYDLLENRVINARY